MRKIIILKWYSLILICGSFLYGLQIFLFPDILNNYRVYQIVSSLFDAHFVGSLFMILGILKIVGVAFNVPMIKKIALISLGFLWTLFGVSFLISPPPNTIWIFALCMALLSFGIGVQEV